MARLPISLQSFIIQCAALVLVGVLTALFQFASPLQLRFQPQWWQLALAQGCLAALLSRVVGQPVWWQPLHFMFFPAILLARQTSVPSWLYLGVFLVLVLFYWSSFRTRVPLYLSDRKAWQALMPLLPATQDFRFIDLGSGLGAVPLYLEPRFPHGRFYGTEIAPAPWLISRLRAWFKRSRVVFLRRDYGAIDLAGFDIVFAFLSPAAMPRLWLQAQQQMRSGSLFISLSFAVEGRHPDHVIALADGARHTLYAWRM
jgi:SAM-dependent methyltransferase